MIPASRIIFSNSCTNKTWCDKCLKVLRLRYVTKFGNQYLCSLCKIDKIYVPATPKSLYNKVVTKLKDENETFK